MSQVDEVEMSWCPVHLVQEVKGHDVTLGPDPYDIEILACGHRVVWFGPEHADAAIIN